MDNSANKIEARQNLNVYRRDVKNASQAHSLSGPFYFSKQNLLYILNTTFLVIIAFIAGYNLNSWQMKKNIGDAVKATEMYLQKAKKNYKESEHLLLSLKKQESRHFEGIITKNPVSPPLKTAVAVSAPTLPRIEQKKATVLPKQTETQKKESKTPFIAQKIPSIKILHTIQEGELLSALVSKAAMAEFLENNPQIKDPDLIYPGQKIFINIPKQSIQTGSYLNNYFIRPAETEDGRATYMLTKSLYIPESETLISYIIKQPGEVINRRTIPYINLSDFTDTMKEEIWGAETFLATRNDKIATINIHQTGTYFETISSHPVFSINTYKGIRSVSGGNYYNHVDSIKDYLIKYLASIQENQPIQPVFHFLIFGETIVQVKYLESATYIEGPDKAKILIGIVHRTKETKNALFKLQSTLATCKSRQGAIIELTESNFSRYR